MWHNCPYLFFNWWYLKLIFVLDTFWTEISTSSQNERRWVDPRTGRLPNWKKMLGPFMELLWVNQSNYRITRQHFSFSQWKWAEYEMGKFNWEEGKKFLLSRDQISSATSVTCFEYQTSHLVINFGLLTQKLSILYELGHI